MNYQAIAKRTSEKIKKAGTAITIVRPGSASGWTKKFNSLTNSWYWENAAGTIVTANPAVTHRYQTYAIVSPASAGAVEAFDIKFKNGTLVESTLRSLMIAASDLQIIPGPGDIVEFPSGDQWSLLGNTPLMPDGETAIYHQGTVKKGG